MVGVQLPFPPPLYHSSSFKNSHWVDATQPKITPNTHREFVGALDHSEAEHWVLETQAVTCFRERGDCGKY
jgi:hypothetical protein